MKKILALLIPSLFAFTGVSQATVMSIGDVLVDADTYTINTAEGVSTSNVEQFVGLSSGTLNFLADGTAKEGSAITDSVLVNIGDTFSFDWIWNTNEIVKFKKKYNDYSFVSLSLDGIDVLADMSTENNTGGHFSWTALSKGELTYGIGVMDVNDTTVDSWLVVNNIKVPEPALFALFGLALVGFGFRRQK